MADFDIVAYAALALSLSVSAAQLGSWLLHANPRAILNLGRWSAVGLAAVTPLVLLWLLFSGRSSIAVMLAAFALPAFIESARRWGGLLPRFTFVRRWRAPVPEPQSIDPGLARECAALLRAYLGQKNSSTPLLGATVNDAFDCGGRPLMTIEEALEVLGLKPGASTDEVREAHRRLEERLDPASGGTRYLAMKIGEAREVLLSV